MRRLILAGLAAAAICAGVGAASAQTVVVQERWGYRDPTWGHQPGSAPHAMQRHWRGHEANYYGHVHNCMVRYQTYDARRDMYREGRRWVACRD